MFDILPGTHFAFDNLNHKIIATIAMELSGHSVVVVAHDHNPTILNPDFLESQAIVPKEWNWKLGSKPPITTPPHSEVHYVNGVSIFVQRDKLQVTEAQITNVDESKISLVAKNYISALQHVNYKELGINFRYIIQHKDPDRYLIDRFLSNGDWRNTDIKLSGTGLSLVYPLDGPVELNRIVLKINSAEMINEKVKNLAISVDANFHRECSKDKLLDYLDNISDDFRKLESLLSVIFEVL